MSSTSNPASQKAFKWGHQEDLDSGLFKFIINRWKVECRFSLMDMLPNLRTGNAFSNHFTECSQNATRVDNPIEDCSPFCLRLLPFCALKTLCAPELNARSVRRPRWGGHIHSLSAF